MIPFEALLLLGAVPVAGCCLYLAVLTLWSAESPAPAPATARLRFDAIVPAHDEEEGIEATVRSLLGVDYPRELFRVVVVADNCTDRTAERAAAAGASVLVREDKVLRGKGYALALAFESALQQRRADAVVVVDADTVVTPNLLSSFAARLESGALAVQADYGVRNPESSWRTRLLRIALGAFHVLRSRARERLGVSAGLRGNGMCFSLKLLRDVPHRSVSLVEDVEYGIELAEAGHRVHYAGEASVLGEMVSGERASRSQRDRWERGRSLLRRRAFALLFRALARRDSVLFDVAADLLVPPLAALSGAAAGGLALSVLLRACGGSVLPAVIFAASSAAIGLYVLRGWMLSGSGLRGLADLACAPFYVLWKVSLSLRRSRGAGQWIRTAREAGPDARTGHPETPP